MKNFFVALSLIVSANAWGFEPPALTGPVIDTAEIIDAGDESYLTDFLRQLNSQGRAQVQVLTVPSIGDEILEQVTIDTVEKYKLGDKDKDNGLLIFVAAKDRKIRIEVGQGLEGVVPDIIANRIIQQKIAPEFREGRFGRGLIAAVGTIEALLDPAHAGQGNGLKAERIQSKGISFLPIIFFFILVFLMSGRRGRRSGAAGFLLGSLMGGRGGFGGGGGGWSGGGGGFSGGGSSGGW